MCILPVIRGLISVQIWHVDGDGLVIVHTECPHLVGINGGRFEVVTNRVKRGGSVPLETGANLELVLPRPHAQSLGHLGARILKARTKSQDV